MPYRCWVATPIGKLRARFVPIQRWISDHGTVYLGHVYLSHGGARRAGDMVTTGRYFAEELDPWNGIQS